MCQENRQVHAEFSTEKKTPLGLSEQLGESNQDVKEHWVYLISK